MQINEMYEDDISFIVKDIIQYKLGLDPNSLKAHAHFKNDLGIDSLDLIELRMEIEKKFSLVIHEEEAGKLTTVGSIITFIRGKRNYS
jgi:acyl carrier protein